MFSLNASGVGWHLPVGLIALAALFIACFAISGYITFRDNSVPETALSSIDDKFDFVDDVHMHKSLTVDSLTVADDINVGRNIVTTFQTGTAFTGWTAVESAIGKLHTVTLTAPADIVDAYTVADTNNVADGYQVYTLPAGDLTVIMASMNCAFKVASAQQVGDIPDVGLGTVQANGAVAALGGTGTFEDILTGQTWNAAVNGAFQNATVNNQVLRRTAAQSHAVFLNVADGWANDTGGDLTMDIVANSSITLMYLVD